MISAVFWDLGGVLLSNGWDRRQRESAVLRFGLDAEDFDDRHREVVGSLETGQCPLDAYLDATVFHTGRSFTRAEFRAFMEAQSEAFEANLSVVDELASAGRYLLCTLNNESRELNSFRAGKFGLLSRFSAFFTSSYLGVMKPSRRIYEIALEVTHRRPDEVLFVDDRQQNVEAAAALGLRTLHFRGEEGPERLKDCLRDRGISFRAATQS